MPGGQYKLPPIGDPVIGKMHVVMAKAIVHLLREKGLTEFTIPADEVEKTKNISVIIGYQQGEDGGTTVTVENPGHQF